MPDKTPATDRTQGGPGSSHQDATEPHPPEGAGRHGPEPSQRRTDNRSDVSGGGGERDSHHTRDPRLK